MTEPRSLLSAWPSIGLLAAIVLALGGADPARAGDEQPDWVQKLDRMNRVRQRLEAIYGSGPRNHGEVRSTYARRGGIRADSNPTSVPILDGDLAFMIEPTNDQVRTRDAHRVTRGGGVLVAVLDGGFNPAHPELAGRMLPWGYDAVDQDFDPEDLGNGWDDDGDGIVDRTVGHGTFVAGMILRAAPEATILPIRVRDDEGWGTNVEMENGLRWAWYMGAQVVNISGEATQGRWKGIANLIGDMRRAGIVVVNSAGNDGLDVVSDLGDWNDTLTVGAVDANDRLAPFSNVTYDRTRLFVLAPGEDLYGPLGRYEDHTSGAWSGTSFAAGWVSGAAALVRSLHPEYTAWEVMWQLRHAAAPVRDQDGAWLSHGRIDLRKAVSR